MDLTDAIAAVEASTGGRVCCHDFDGSVAAVVGESRIQHRLPSCARAKRDDGTRCTAFDLHACQQRLAAAPDGFWKVCHAGILEAYVPLRSGGRNLGALFLGPWHRTAPPPGALVEAGPPAAAATAPPPAPPAAELARILALARLLAAAVSAAAAGIVADGGRRGRILRLVDEGLHGRFRLGDLAAELGLSPSRCGHVVRAETGLTFPALLESRRLERARRMLVNSPLTAAEIAIRCGFADDGHFHRRFRAAAGCTPGEYRRRGPA